MVRWEDNCIAAFALMMIRRCGSAGAGQHREFLVRIRCREALFHPSTCVWMQYPKSEDTDRIGVEEDRSYVEGRRPYCLAAQEYFDCHQEQQLDYVCSEARLLAYNVQDGLLVGSVEGPPVFYLAPRARFGSFLGEPLHSVCSDSGHVAACDAQHSSFADPVRGPPA